MRARPARTDMLALCADPAAFRHTVERLAHCVTGPVSRILSPGPEGVILGAAVAYHLRIGLVALPRGPKGPLLDDEALQPGEVLLYIDAHLASGETAEAALHLAERQGADLRSAAFLNEAPARAGRRRLEALGIRVHVLG